MEKEILIPLITFAGGVVIALVTAFATPLAGRIVGGKQAELKEEVARLKANQLQLQAAHDDHLDKGLEGWQKMGKRAISYQIAVLENEVGKSLARRELPVVDILGTNATGPLHQGREALINALTAGGTVRVLLLDPESQAFRSRAVQEGDDVGRIAAELLASLHILMDIMAGPARAKNVEIRLYDAATDRSLIILNRLSGVVVSNPYPDLERARGLTGKMYKWLPEDRYYTDDCEHFEELWNTAERIELRRGETLPWPFRKVG